MASKTTDVVLMDSEDNEVVVSITTFPARKGISIGRRLISICKPLSGSLKGMKFKDLFTNGKFTFNSLASSDINIGSIIETLMDAVGDDRVDQLILDLCRVCIVGKKDVASPAMFDIVFADEYGLLLKVLQKVIALNFKSFFGKGVIGRIQSNLNQTVTSENEKKSV